MTHPADKLRADLEAKKKAAEKQRRTGGPSKKKAEPSAGAKEQSKEDKVARTSSKTSTKRGTKTTAKAKAVKKAKPAKVAKPKTKAKPAKKETSKAKPAKKAAAKAKPKAVKKSNGVKTKTKSNGSSGRTFDRDKSGDGLRPVERQIIKTVYQQAEPTALASLATWMFGSECGSEGGNSVRTVRNAIRKPVQYGILESGGRGKVAATQALRDANGDFKKVALNYRREIEERKAAEYGVQ